MPVPALDYRHLPAQKATGSVEDLMRMAVIGGREAIMRMRVAHAVMRVGHGVLSYKWAMRSLPLSRTTPGGNNGVFSNRA